MPSRAEKINADLPDYSMTARTGPHESQYLKLREWLLLLLRFAVTRSPSDQASVFALAHQLDSVGPKRKTAEPRFFQRKSREVCEAILTDDSSHAALRIHAARIDDPRLRRAFLAAVGLQPTILPQGANQVRVPPEPEQERNDPAPARKMP